MTKTQYIAAVVSLTALAGSAHAQDVFTGTGLDAAGLQAVVDDFRVALGDFNPPEPCTRGEGRRQIDWDAAPDAVSAPNPFPGDFFNADFFPRARGLVFQTPGTGFQLSATAESGVGINFSNLDPSYENTFQTFSPERLFTPLDSTEVLANFEIPGRQINAVSRGFGAVFSDVDIAGTTTLEFFDRNGNSLGAFEVPTQDAGLSFVGVVFDEPVVASVRIISGNTPLAQGVVDDPNAGIDLVVMDDFIFGEPTSSCPADLDGNGLVDSDDYWAFLDMFVARDACADLDRDGSIDADDFFGFLDAFVLGC